MSAAGMDHAIDAICWCSILYAEDKINLLVAYCVPAYSLLQIRLLEPYLSNYGAEITALEIDSQCSLWHR